MSSPNADLIAVSLACPKDPTSPYRMGPPRESSVRNLLEKVGNLRDIAVLVQSNFGIFDICRSTLTQSNCLGLSSSIFFKWDFWSKKNYAYFFFFGFIGFVLYFWSWSFAVSFYASMWEKAATAMQFGKGGSIGIANAFSISNG